MKRRGEEIKGGSGRELEGEGGRGRKRGKGEEGEEEAREGRRERRTSGHTNTHTRCANAIPAQGVGKEGERGQVRGGREEEDKH